MNICKVLRKSLVNKSIYLFAIITIIKCEEPKVTSMRKTEARDKGGELNMRQTVFRQATSKHFGVYSNINEKLSTSGFKLGSE